MSFSPESMRLALESHAEVCSQLLDLSRREEQSLRGTEHFQAGRNDESRRKLTAELDQTLGSLKSHRVAWQQLPPAERTRHPEIVQLILSTQKIGMKLIVLDRENEQALLRRGLLPPRQLPSSQRQQPNYVAGLYRRHRV